MAPCPQPPVFFLLAVAALLAEVAGNGGRGQLVVEMGGGGGGSVAGGGVRSQQMLNNSLTVVLPGEAAKLACPLPSDVFGSFLRAPQRVSWIRRRDMQLLAIGETLFTGDHRIFVSHSRHPHKRDSRHTQVWFLHLKNVTKEDEGEYECQMSTHPPTSYMASLKVQPAWSELQGTAVRHVAAGSTLRLVCTIREAQLPLKYVFWYQDSKMINFDKERGVSFTLERDYSFRSTSGTLVWVQDQASNAWDGRSVITEVRPHRQRTVQLNGSGRLSVRNRKHLRPVRASELPRPPLRDPGPSQPAASRSPQQLPPQPQSAWGRPGRNVWRPQWLNDFV